MKASRSRAVLLAAVLAVAVVAMTGCSGGGAASLDGTSWKLTGWSNTTQKPGDFNVTIAFKDGKLTGHAPVNSYGGDYTVTSGGGFSAGQVNSTLMAGPEPANQAEKTYFELLGKAKKYEVSGDTLTLSDTGGAMVLEFSATK